MTEAIRRFRLYLSMVGYANSHNQDFAREHWAFFRDMRGRLAALGKDPRGLRILEVGCGKSYWLTLLLHGYGAKVTGIDTEVIVSGRSPAKYWRIWRQNGLERSARTLIWDLLYAAPYYRELAACADFALPQSGVDVRCGNVALPEFAPREFDLIVSHEVFEHIADVEAAAVRLQTLLKPDGLTYIYVHSFTSLSGGHHIAWKYPDTEPSTTVPPWDHLRQRLFPLIPSWVNGLREHQYRDIFTRHFDILDWLPTKPEGQHLLTPEIRSELAAYSEHELLNKGFIIVARPKATDDRS
jgi:SAM-dependent methyltransferase